MYIKAYLDSTKVFDDKNLQIGRYNLLRADHSPNNKTGAVCIYYKNLIGLRLINAHYLQECLMFEIWIGGKLCYLIFLYRSPS